MVLALTALHAAPQAVEIGTKGHSHIVIKRLWELQ
jgi:hypothetical protein